MRVFRSIIIWDPFGKQMTQLNRKHVKSFKVTIYGMCRMGNGHRNIVVSQD